MFSFKIEDISVGGITDPIFIIAEIGQNHQGNINIAKQMISEAKKIGCNCVKFQKSCLSAKFTKDALNRPYSSQNSWGETYGEHKKFLEFSAEQFAELQEFCQNKKILFSASAMDEISLDQLNKMEVPFIKIGSGDANNFPLLEKAATFSRPLIISTGMQAMSTVETIVHTMKIAQKTNFALLHCVSSYPTDAEYCNIQIIRLLQTKYPGTVIGYSGHELNIAITEAAVLLGAKIIERHFTLDKTQKGSDHKCSLLPTEFRQLISRIRFFEDSGVLKKTITYDEVINILDHDDDVLKSFNGSYQKVILPCELSCRTKLGKSLVSAKKLPKGHILLKEDIQIKVSEPNGISAEFLNDFLGKKLASDIKKDFPIQCTDLIGF